MPISASCNACGRQLRLSDDRAGKRIRCPDCGEVIEVGTGKAKVSAKPAGSPQRRRSRSGRPAGRKKRRKSSGGGQQKFVILGGALLAVAVGGVAAWVVLFSGDRAADTNVAATEQTATPRDDVPVTGSATPRDSDSEVVGDVTPATTAQAAGDGAIASTGTSSASTVGVKPATNMRPTAGSVATGRPPAVERSRPSGSPASRPARAPSVPVISGERVAWEMNPGTGFARSGDGWIFYGSHGAFARENVRAPSTLIETMRNDRFIELFDCESQNRVRIEGQKVTIYKPETKSRTKTLTLVGGQWTDSTEAFARLGIADVTVAPGYIFPTLPEDTKLRELIATVERNVVRVNVSTSDGAGNGSGFLLDPSGRIITNYHVVEGCRTCSVVFKGENGESDVQLPVDGFLHADAKKDIAIIQVALPRSFRRSGLKLASQLPQKGTSVVAFGAPLGLDFTASEGIVSGFRSSNELKSTLGLGGTAGNWIQTTAPISPGNSGGPLVDQTGRVVAINTMTLTMGQSLNFGISCDDMRAAVIESDLVPMKLTPTSVPVLVASRGSGKSGSANPGEVVEELPGGIKVVDIQDTELGKKMLAELEEVLYMPYPRATDQGSALLQGLIRGYARDSLETVDVGLVLDEGPILMVIAVPSLDNLQLVAHLYAPDRSSRTPRIVRMWRGAGDMGELTRDMRKRKRFTGKVHKSVAALFGDLKTAIVDARKAEAESTSPGSDPEDGQDD